MYPNNKPKLVLDIINTTLEILPNDVLLVDSWDMLIKK